MRKQQAGGAQPEAIIWRFGLDERYTKRRVIGLFAGGDQVGGGLRVFRPILDDALARPRTSRLRRKALDRVLTVKIAALENLDNLRDN